MASVAPAALKPGSPAGVTGVSPSDFASGSLFGQEYSLFGLYSRSSFLGAIILLAMLLGVTPPATDSPVRYVMHYVGYAIFWLMWRQTNRAARFVLSDLAVNDAIAVSATQRIDEARKAAISGGSRHKVEDLQLLLPVNKAEPAMLRLLIRICQDATAWRFDSLSTLIAPYQRESLALKARLENTQRVALRWGILGAFVGLVLALKDLQQLAASPDALVRMDQFLPGFLGALYLKFGASIGGLAASLYGFAMTSFADRRQAKYFQDMEAAASSLLDLAAKSLKYSAFVDEFGVVRTALKDLQNELHDQAKKASDLNENVQRLANVGANIGNFTSALEKEHSKFLSDLQRLYDQASMVRVFKSLETAVVGINKQSQEAIGHQFQVGLGTVNRDFGTLKGAMTELEQSVGRLCSRTIGAVGAIVGGAVIILVLARLF